MDSPIGPAGALRPNGTAMPGPGRTSVNPATRRAAYRSRCNARSAAVRQNGGRRSGIRRGDQRPPRPRRTTASGPEPCPFARCHPHRPSPDRMSPTKVSRSSTVVSKVVRLIREHTASGKPRSRTTRPARGPSSAAGGGHRNRDDSREGGPAHPRVSEAPCAAGRHAPLDVGRGRGSSHRNRDRSHPEPGLHTHDRSAVVELPGLDRLRGPVRTADRDLRARPARRRTLGPASTATLPGRCCRCWRSAARRATTWSSPPWARKGHSPGSPRPSRGWRSVRQC